MRTHNVGGGAVLAARSRTRQRTRSTVRACYARSNARYRLDIRLAVDTNEECVKIYQTNFGRAEVRASDVSILFHGDPGTALSRPERALAQRVGAVDILIGGPPCQGHSDLNNHTRRRDPKNALYLRMARAADVLKPKAVVIENVATVQWDATGVVERTVAALIAAGYKVAQRVVDLRLVGVPKTRKRPRRDRWPGDVVRPRINFGDDGD